MSEKNLALACSKVISKKSMYEAHLGIEIEDIDFGYAKVTMKVQDFMINGNDTCHGGAIFSFADMTFAYACNTKNIPTVAFSCDITYLKPAFKNDLLTAVGKVRSMVGRNGICEVTISNQNNETIAFFLGKSKELKGSILNEKQLKEVR